VRLFLRGTRANLVFPLTLSPYSFSFPPPFPPFVAIFTHGSAHSPSCPAVPVWNNLTGVNHPPPQTKNPPKPPPNPNPKQMAGSLLPSMSATASPKKIPLLFFFPPTLPPAKLRSVFSRFLNTSYQCSSRNPTSPIAGSVPSSRAFFSQKRFESVVLNCTGRLSSFRSAFFLSFWQPPFYYTTKIHYSASIFFFFLETIPMRVLWQEATC